MAGEALEAGCSQSWGPAHNPEGLWGIQRISVGLADGLRGAQWEHQDRELRAGGDGQRGLQ